jgi:hypothetical protein
LAGELRISMNIAAQERRSRRILGLLLYVVAAACGWSEVFHPDHGGLLQAFFALAFSILLTYWCIIDSRVMGRPILSSFSWLIFFFWPVGAPSYLIWSRKWRGLGLAVLHAIGFCGVDFAFYNLAGCLVYGSAWFHRP